MKYIIDRFEGNLAVVELENGKLIDIPKEVVPEGAREGDVVKTTIDRQETQKLKADIRNLENEIFSD